jgi:hypothetical protein
MPLTDADFGPEVIPNNTKARSMAPGQISGCKVAGRLRGRHQAVQLAGRLVRADAAVRDLCQERCQLWVWRRAVMGAWAKRNLMSHPATVQYDHQTAVRTLFKMLNNSGQMQHLYDRIKEAANVQQQASAAY